MSNEVSLPGVLFRLQENKGLSRQEIPVPCFFGSRTSLLWLLQHISKASLPSAKLKTHCLVKEGEGQDTAVPRDGQELY